MLRNRPDRGIVLVMVVAILVMMAMAATAFVIFMREAYQAASNTQHMAQAELAARSGIEHAIRVIEHAGKSYASPTGALDADDPSILYTDAGDVRAGWYRCFEPGPGDGAVRLSDASKWASSHDGQNIRGRVFDFPSSGSGKRGEYAVYVLDLDAKLHANIARWNGGLGNNAAGIPTDIRPLVKAVAAGCGLTDADAAEAVKRESAGAFFSSLSEMSRRAGISTISAGKYRLEHFFTVYPIHDNETWPSYETAGTPTHVPVSDTSLVTLVDGDLTSKAAIGSSVVFAGSAKAFGIVDNDASSVTVRGNCSDQPAGAHLAIMSRPAVNVNTVSEELLAELVKPICGFLAAVDSNGPRKAEALAKYICACRPFRDRHEFEGAARRITGDDALTDLRDYVEQLPAGSHLSERQFNDLLNSAAGVIEEDESAYDEPGNPGVHTFDGWAPFADGIGPSQTGGHRTNSSNITWSTEFKFTSRFFHIYAVGRGWCAGKAAGVRRAHAIYDGETNHIVWMRWNLSSRGSIADIGQ